VPPHSVNDNWILIDGDHVCSTSSGELTEVARIAADVKHVSRFRILKRFSYERLLRLQILVGEVAVRGHITRPLRIKVSRSKLAQQTTQLFELPIENEPGALGVV
jgi:hypothetical protein